MTFKKILPWLIGVILLVLLAVGAFFARFWLFDARAGTPMMRGFPQGGFERGFGRGDFGGGPMMGGGFGGHMAGPGGLGGFGIFGMVLGPLFYAGLFLFLVWAVLKIIRSSNRAEAYAAPARTCPNCGKAAAADWNTCPYCAADLKARVDPPSEPAA